MATIRVTCPTCGEVLEVAAEDAGTEVECGEWLPAFVVKGPGGGKIKGAPAGREPRGKPARKRRDDDDDDDYEHDRVEEYDDDDYEPPGRGRRGRGGQYGLRPAGTVLVLGIVSI